jgi:uncharacterized protein YndB with AHSA1/START domain
MSFTTTIPILRGRTAALLFICFALFAFKQSAFAEPRNGEKRISSQNAAATKTLDVVVTRVFDAPVELVWKAWSDSDHVMRWWGPTGFTSPLARIDFRVGGVSLVCMRAPKEFGGQDMYNTWTYQKIEPLERIEFIFHFTDKDGNRLDPAKMGVPPGIPQEVPHVITFKRLAENKTEMTIRESGYTSETAVAISKAGLEQCLDKMAASFAKS